jgi:SAM-dependent methyltransferase
MTILYWTVALIVLAFGFVVFWGAPYVPSKKKDLERALDELYSLSENDVLVDIGSGDGIVLRAAARRGARAIGYELNPLLVAIARWISRGEPRVQVHVANMWHIHLPPETTVVYVFTVVRDIAKLTRKFDEEATRLGKTLNVISYGCEVPGRTPLKTLGAHNLYEFTPLQIKKA